MRVPGPLNPRVWCRAECTRPPKGLSECGECGARQSALAQKVERVPSVASVVPGRVHSLKRVSECGDCGAHQRTLAKALCECGDIGLYEGALIQVELGEFNGVCGELGGQEPHTWRPPGLQ